MNTHYIPKLLLRRFATGDRVNTYDFKTESFNSKKLKNTFSEKDLFDSELEAAFASRLEGPVGDILNNKLLKGRSITIDRRENLLLRKFLMINFLRAPIVNGSWDEMVERTQLQNHPSAQARDFLIRHSPELREVFDRCIPSAKSYISDLKTAMEYDSIEDILKPAKEYNSIEDILKSENKSKVSTSLRMAAQHALVTTIAFWDSEDSSQEFILPKLPGICMMDQVSITHKPLVLMTRRQELESTGLDEDLKRELGGLIYGSTVYPENFSIYPISPTRALICFSPYFKAFFPIMDATNTVQLYPPILERVQFDRHFFQPMRMELFKRCKNIFNKIYSFEVKTLTAEEVMGLNSMLLDMETEEFAFHDYNKIRDSFWYYDKRARFALPKKHDFSHMV